MFTREDRTFVESILDRFASKGEKGGAKVQKGFFKVSRVILIALSIVFIGGALFLLKFGSSMLSKKK